MTEAGGIKIRKVETSDLPAIIDLVRELRPHIDLALLQQRFAEQVLLGYELHAAMFDGIAVGLAGFRPVVTLARGRYLHLDDLVVAASHQRDGIGRLLLDHVEAEGLGRGHDTVVLDARPTAIPFYEARSYAPHPSPSYWKALKS